MSSSDLPKTPAEAEDRDRRIRRQLWLGLAAIFAIVVLLIILVMEGRYRAALDDPQPSAGFDRAMQGVVASLAPFPETAREIEMRTQRLDGSRYYVLHVYDADGDVLYQFARSARSVGLIEHGPRAGDPVNLHVRLELDDDYGLSGAYRPDRGVAVERYQGVATGMLREGLAAWHTASSHPLPETEEREPEALRAEWRRIMD